MTWSLMECGRHFAGRRLWEHAPAIHAASHVDHKNELRRFSISMHALQYSILHACGSVLNFSFSFVVVCIRSIAHHNSDRFVI